MRHILLLLILLLLSTLSASAVTYYTFEGSCEEPGQPVVTQGLNSTTPVQIDHVPCKITVYLHGTSTLATLYQDDLGTPLTNPFNSQSNGYFHFEVSQAGEYDYVMDNTTTGNPTTPSWSAPFTVSGIQLGAAGGGGGGSTTPGGSPNDVQVNVANTTFGGTNGLFQYNPALAALTLNSPATFVSTGTLFDLSGSTHTRPMQAGTLANGLVTACSSPKELYLATDSTPQPEIMPCVGGFFAAPLLPSVPGNTAGQVLMNVNGTGTIGVASGFYWDSVGAVLNIPGTMALNSTKPFSMSGSCPAATPLGSSTVGTALIGWDVGCIPKISFNGGSTLTIGLQSLIDYTYLKLDANNCWAIGPTTGDAGWARIGAGVLGLLNCGTVSSPTKLNIYSTYTSSTVSDYLSCGWVPSLSVYFCGADHGSLGGAYHPITWGAAGSLTPMWGIQVTGPFTCQTQNPNCDIGSITTGQQPRNIWQNGFHSINIIGPTYPVNASGVQIGLVAVGANVNPVQATTAAVTDISGTLGIVAYLSNGSVTGATIVSGGAGYTGPTCAVSAPVNPSSVTATCTATQAAGVINSVTITNTGSNNGYQSIQGTVITISDPNGTGASILPIITATTGFAGIAQNGSTFSPIFDGATTIRHRVCISTTNAGMLHDCGSAAASYIPGNQKTYGYINANSAGGAGTSVAMTVNMVEASEEVFLAATPSGTSCPTAASVGSLCKDTITLPTAMPDTNYVAKCNIAAVTTGVPVQEGVLTADKGLGNFKIQISAGSAVAAQVTNYDCTVRHQ